MVAHAFKSQVHMDKEAEHLAAVEESKCGIPLPNHSAAGLLEPPYIPSVLQQKFTQFHWSLERVKGTHHGPSGQDEDQDKGMDPPVAMTSARMSNACGMPSGSSE